LLAPLVETRSDANGAYRFDDVPVSPSCGVIAIADGQSFGGKSTRVSLSQQISGFDIRLARPDSISGKIVSIEGDAVPGARISRVAIPASSIGIPLAKLAAFGFAEPVSGEGGAFTVDRLPAGAVVDLKVSHPQFAQEGAMGIKAGTRDARVTMDRGVLVTGTVISRGEGSAVAGADVLLRKPQPPSDTVIARTHSDGGFTVRLKPGAYVAEASGELYRSLAGQSFVVTGQSVAQQVAVYVAGTGSIAGRVQDALSGKPIAGARLILESQGIRAAVEVTSATGEYRFRVAAGDNVIRVESAPGFHDPQQRALQFQVGEGQTVEHNFWLAPLPDFTVLVLDQTGKPAPRVALRLVRPAQLGWRLTDAQGRARFDLAHLPAGGGIIGLAEDPHSSSAALFSAAATASKEITVQLLPLGTVSGRVTDSRGDSLEGAAVEARYVDEASSEAIVLWRTVAGQDGAFAWRGVLPHLPQVIAASAGSEAVGESAPFILADEMNRDVGNVVVPGEGVKGKSSMGKRIEWRKLPVQCGETPAGPGKPSVLVYCPAENAAMYAEILAQLYLIYGGGALDAVVVTNGDVACPQGTTSVPILLGAAPGSATVYVLDSAGVVTLECHDLPPLHALAGAR
jgi:hypothetical protein